MTTCRIRVTRDTPASGAFEWVTIGKQGEMLASGSANLARPSDNTCAQRRASRRGLPWAWSSTTSSPVNEWGPWK